MMAPSWPPPRGPWSVSRVAALLRDTAPFHQRPCECRVDAVVVVAILDAKPPRRDQRLPQWSERQFELEPLHPRALAGTVLSAALSRRQGHAQRLAQAQRVARQISRVGVWCW